MRGTTVTAVLVSLLALAAQALPVAAQTEEPVVAVRLGGETRLETAVAISQDDFPDPATAQSVVLGRAFGDEDDPSRAFPDALAGSPLAASVVGRGPLLLTRQETLPQVTEDEIRRVLLPSRPVYLLGGEAAISEDVANQLRMLGYQAERLAGFSRYETSVEIARAAAPEGPGFIVLADGNTFPDALIGGALAAASAGGVLLLTNGTEPHPAVEAFLEEHPDVGATTIGPAAGTAHPDFFNVGGEDQYERSVRTAELFLDAPSGVALASGEEFADGLAGGAHAFRRDVRLLLTPPEEWLDRADAYVRDLAEPDRGFIYGGVNAITEDVEEQFNAALNGT